MTVPTPPDLGWAASASSRMEIWTRFVREQGLQSIAEVGVFRGQYAEELLAACPDIKRYYLIDPWRHLDDWNKPANAQDSRFDEYLAEVMARTEPYADKRVVLRGRTTEVIDEIPDEDLDFAYIDGDHTLRGITIDLSRVWPKVKPGAWIGGDDFSRTVWQHAEKFEPTLVFPYAVYFAEAVGAPIHALGHNQFLIQKSNTGFSFTDLTGRYGDVNLRTALKPRNPQKGKAVAAKAKK